MKLSKKLKNLIILEGKEEDLNEFFIKLKSKYNLIFVKSPKNLSLITDKYIEQNWKIPAIDTQLSVIYGRNKSKSFITFFNPEIEILALELVNDLKLKATYNYFLPDKKKGIIQVEKYYDGILQNDYESNPICIKDYDLAECFINI